MKRLYEESFGSLAQEKIGGVNENPSVFQSKRLQDESLFAVDTTFEPITDFPQVPKPDCEIDGQLSDFSCTEQSLLKSRFVALTAMIDQCSHLELVHLYEAIKPKLKRDFFTLLPAELVFRILSYLSLQDVLHCAQVSRRWYQVTNDPLLWFQLYHKARLSNQSDVNLPNSLSVTCQENYFGGILSGTPNSAPSSMDVTSTEINWKSLYRTTLEVQCNWRNGSPWAPVILPAHHNHVITCLEVYNDWAITGSDDASICIWNLTTNQLIISLFGHLGGVWSLVVLSPPAVSSANDLNNVNQIPLLVSGSCDRSARVWLLDGSHWPCITTLYGHQSTVRCVAGQGNDVLSTTECHSCRKQHEHEHPSESRQNDSASQDSGISTEAGSDLKEIRLVVTGSRDTTLRLWDAGTGRCLQVFQGHLGAVRCVQFVGHVVVSGSYDCTIRLWCICTGQCLRVLHGHRNRVYTLLFDGRHIISASLDTTIRVWDAPTGRLEQTFCGHQSLTSEMAYAAAQHLLVSSNADETIRVWDVASGECVHVLAGPYKHHSAVTCVQLSRNFIISSSDDGTVKLWDRRTGAYIRDLVRLDEAGRGAVVWRIVASETRLVCAVGSRSGVETTKLIVLRFEEPITNPVTLATAHRCRPITQPVAPSTVSQLVAASSHVFLSDDSLSDSLTA